MIIDAQAVHNHLVNGTWRKLESLAKQMIADAEQKAGGNSMSPLLGGGTRLMLAMKHRISDDIDLFIRDPQWMLRLAGG